MIRPAGVFRADHLRLALDAAVRGGDDTDTVAAIAGGLLGAVYGASAVPAEWRRDAARLARACDPGPGGAGHPNREGGASPRRLRPICWWLATWD